MSDKLKEFRSEGAPIRIGPDEKFSVSVDPPSDHQVIFQHMCAYGVDVHLVSELDEPLLVHLEYGCDSPGIDPVKLTLTIRSDEAGK